MSEDQSQKHQTKGPTVASCLFCYTSGLKYYTKNNKKRNYNNKIVLTESLIQHFDGLQCESVRDAKKNLNRQMRYWYKLNEILDYSRDFMEPQLEKKLDASFELLESENYSDRPNNVRNAQPKLHPLKKLENPVEQQLELLPTDVLQMFLAKDYKPQEYYRKNNNRLEDHHQQSDKTK